MTAPEPRPETLTDAGRDWLRMRVRQLRSRQANVGPFRAAGIQRTIEAMKQQIREGIWIPRTGEGPTQPQPTSQSQENDQ